MEYDRNSEFTNGIRETLNGQLTAAHAGYMAVWRVVGNGKLSFAVSEDRLTEEFNAWLTDKRLTQVAAIQADDPDTSFTLVATPNSTVAMPAILETAQQALKGDVMQHVDNFYDRYSAKALSGTNPSNGNSAQFSVIPSKFTPRFFRKIDQQNEILKSLRAKGIEMRVPSVLESVAHLVTRKVADLDIAGRESTEIRHFNMNLKRANIKGSVEKFVPRTYVDDLGRLHFSVSGDKRPRSGRVTIA